MLAPVNICSVLSDPVLFSSICWIGPHKQHHNELNKRADQQRPITLRCDFMLTGGQDVLSPRPHTSLRPLAWLSRHASRHPAHPSIRLSVRLSSRVSLPLSSPVSHGAAWHLVSIPLSHICRLALHHTHTRTHEAASTSGNDLSFFFNTGYKLDKQIDTGMQSHTHTHTHTHS